MSYITVWTETMRDHFTSLVEERGYIKAAVDYLPMAPRWLFSARLPNGELTEQCFQVCANEVHRFVEKNCPEAPHPTYAEMNETVTRLLSAPRSTLLSLPEHYHSKRAVRMFVSMYVVRQFPVVDPPKNQEGARP